MIRKYQIHAKWFRKKIMRKIIDAISFEDKNGMSITYKEENSGFGSVFNITVKGPDCYTKIAGFTNDFINNEKNEKETN